MLENLQKYVESKHILELRQINKKLIREGNAVNLDPSITIPLRPRQIIMNYYKNGIFNIPVFDRDNGKCFIGPLITVNVDGIVTECDASLEHQRTIYNYGNNFDSSIEDICLNNNPIFEKSNKLHRSIDRTLKRY